MPIDPPTFSSGGGQDTESPGHCVCPQPGCDGFAEGHVSLLPIAFFDDEREPILTPSPHRFTLYPIKYRTLWAFYKQATSVFWFIDTPDLSVDLSDWGNKLTLGDRHFVSSALALSVSPKASAYETIIRRLACQVQITEARCFYGLQAASEHMHMRTRTYLLETLVPDYIKHHFIYNAVEKVPSLQRKTAWISRWLETDNVPFRVQLLAFAVSQAMSLSGTFASLFELEERGLLPAVSHFNRLMFRDKELHVDFACELFRQLNIRPCIHIVTEMVEEAVAIEKNLVIDHLPCSLVGLDVKDMACYIEYVGDRLLERLGYDRMYFACNPFAFFDFAIAGRRDFL